jgi:hypothetical protein
MKKELELKFLKLADKQAAHLLNFIALSKSEGQARILISHLHQKGYFLCTEFGWKITKLGKIRLRELENFGEPVGVARSKGLKVTSVGLPRFSRAGAEDASALPSLVQGVRVF